MAVRLPLDPDLVGKILIARDNRNLKRYEIVDLMSAETGLAEGTLMVKIRKYEDGHIFGERLTTAASEKEDQGHLRAFAIYLRILGFDPRSEVISGVRKYDSRFVYTKLSSQKQGKKCDPASDSVA